MKIKLLIIGVIVLVSSSCKKLLTPDIENLKNIDQMYTDPAYAQGFLVNTYRMIPSYYDNTEYATDDAVTNQKSNGFLKMATGAWTASNNPVNMWQNSYGAIQYLNLFLANVDKVKWADDEEAAKLFNMRMKGEAYGMRALFMYYLLRNHAGFSVDGELLGVPIITEYQTINSDLNQPRATFAECVAQIYSDLDKAEENLPYEYKDVASSAQIPDRFRAVTESVASYNRVMGVISSQLFNGLIAQSFRARTALLAASPSFNTAGDANNAWTNAANAAAEIIDYKGGVSALPANGNNFYSDATEINGLGSGVNPAEIIWRENISTNSTVQEGQNYPPSLNGTGYMNPTDNLIKSYPMANGYPISDNINSGYVSTSPFAGRDPRLAKSIVYNGSTEGVSSATILTSSNSGTADGINVRETSTRTGYYMKKRLRMDVSVISGAVTGQTHYNPRIRYTEMYLDYAEAANEAWGPTGTGTNAYSAYDVIKAIRKRAGVGTTNGDPYLEACKGDQGKMQTLIHNERRLELSFESFRFWDLRRWKADLNETAKGLDIKGGLYTEINVEERSFQDYMYYGPIPYSEILKYNKLKQNKGWN